MVGIDAVVALGGLIVPPVFDFLRKKFVKSEADTPERTLGTLATTKPEVLGDYTRALADLKRAETEYFNRDATGAISPWVSNLRAIIRPLGVLGSGIYLLALTVLVCSGYVTTDLSPDTLELIFNIRLSAEAIISSWFGSRIGLRS